LPENDDKKAGSHGVRARRLQKIHLFWRRAALSPLFSGQRTTESPHRTRGVRVDLVSIGLASLLLAILEYCQSIRALRAP